MRITINLDSITNEQLKFLSQLGMFLDDDRTWESHCESEELPKAINALKGAGINELSLRLVD